MALLEVKNLKTYFDTDAGTVKAVDGISFSMERGKTLGVVGESGCGKSVTALSVMRLLPKAVGRVAEGEILLDGKNLLDLSEPEMRKVRGNEISMIFQEPMTSLNPVYTLGDQIMEPLKLHQKMKEKEARAICLDMLELVGIPSPKERMDQYPHQLSGGMRQRAMIAMALACNPAVLIADEPTTALDVTVQAQILDLMNDLKQRLDSAIMFITHDLGVIAQMAQRVAVMYAGKIVEDGDVEPLYKEPLHPYTQGLLNSIPRLDWDKDRLDVIPGVVPSPLDFPKGCKFHNRCKKASDRCSASEPPIFCLKGGRKVRCWLYEKSPMIEGEER